MECQSITLMVHQELEMIPLRIQQLSHQGMLIEFDNEVDVQWVAQKLLWKEWWIGAPCHIESVPCGSDERLQQFRGRDLMTHKRAQSGSICPNVVK